MIEKTYYTNPGIDYLINHYIREYDMIKAGPSAYLQAGCITQEQYDHLISLPRERRQIETGLLSKYNPGFEDAKKQVIAETRQKFIETNGIDDSDILSIKNDAIFVIDKACTALDFDKMHLTCKNIYSSYYRYNRVELFYYKDNMTGQDLLDVKNIGSHTVLHTEYMMDFLSYIFDLAQSNIKETIAVIQQFESDYVSGKLDLGYYREFNAKSCFKLSNSISSYFQYHAAHLPKDIPRTELDISYNLLLVRHLYKIYSSIILK